MEKFYCSNLLLAENKSISMEELSNSIDEIASTTEESQQKIICTPDVYFFVTRDGYLFDYFHFLH